MNRRKRLDYTPSRDTIRQRSKTTRAGSSHGDPPKSSGVTEQTLDSQGSSSASTSAAAIELKSILREGDRKGDNDEKRSRRSMSPLGSLRTNYEDDAEPDTTGTAVLYQEGSAPLVNFGELPLVEECDYYFMADVRGGHGGETFKIGSQDTSRSTTGSSRSSDLLKALPGFGSRWTEAEDRDTSKYSTKRSSTRDSRDRNLPGRDYGRHGDRSSDNSDLRSIIDEQRNSKGTVALSDRSNDWPYYDKGRKKREYDEDSRDRDKTRSKYSRRNDKTSSRILSVAAQELMDEEEKESHKRDLYSRKDKEPRRDQNYGLSPVSPRDKASHLRDYNIEKEKDVRDQRYEDFGRSPLSARDRLDDSRRFSDFGNKTDDRDTLLDLYDQSLTPEKGSRSDRPGRSSYEDKMKGYFWSESRATGTSYSSIFHDRDDVGRDSFLFADEGKERIDEGYIRDLKRLTDNKGGSPYDRDKSRGYSDEGDSSYRASSPLDLSSNKDGKTKKETRFSAFELGTSSFGRTDSTTRADNSSESKYPERKSKKTGTSYTDHSGSESDYDRVYSDSDKLSKRLLRLSSAKISKRERILDDNYPTLYSDKEERPLKETRSLQFRSTGSSRGRNGAGLGETRKSGDPTVVTPPSGVRGRGRWRGGFPFRGRGRGVTAPFRGRGRARGGTFPTRGRGRGRGESFRGRGRGFRGRARGSIYVGRGRSRDSRDSHPPIRGRDTHPLTRGFGMFRNVFMEKRGDSEPDSREERSSPEDETKTSCKSHSYRSDRSTSRDRREDRRESSRSTSREGTKRSQITYSQQDRSTEELKGDEPKSSKEGTAKAATKTLESKSKQSGVGLRQIREESADKNKSLASKKASSDKAHSKRKRRRSRSSSSSSSSSCSCSVSSCSCCSSSFSDSSSSSKRRSRSVRKKADSNQSRRIVIKLSSKDKRSVIMEGKEGTGVSKEKKDDRKSKKTAQGKPVKKQDSPAARANKSDAKNASSVVDSKLESALSGHLSDIGKGLAKPGVSKPPGKDMQKKKSAPAARRPNALSLREQNKLIESFWSTREQPEKPLKDIPVEKIQSDKSEMGLLYSEFFPTEESSSDNRNLQGDHDKRTVIKGGTSITDDKSAPRKEKTVIDHKRTVEKGPAVRRSKTQKPSSHANRKKAPAEQTEDLNQFKMAQAENSLSYRQGFGIQNERGGGRSEYATNKGPEKSKQTTRQVRGNLISIIPDPNAFEQPTRQVKRQSEYTASTMETPRDPSHWPPAERGKKDLTHQQPRVSKSEPHSYPLHSEQTAVEGENLEENVPTEQVYENEHYEEGLAAGQEWTTGERETEQYETYYYEEGDYQGEEAEGVQQYTEGEWADGQYVDAYTEEEQQAWQATEGSMQEAEGNPDDYWEYEGAYEDTEYAAVGEQEAQLGEERWVDPATGYAYDDPQAYAVTEGYGQDEVYYEEHQWQQQQQQESGVVPVDAGQEYYGDNTAESGGYYDEQYQGDQAEIYEEEGAGEAGYINKEQGEEVVTEDTQESTTEDPNKPPPGEGIDLSEGDRSPAKSPLRVHSPSVEPPKPLKSILKKSKLRSESIQSSAGVASSSASQPASVLADEPKDAIGQECIVKLSGERAAFYCKLCQCHFNTVTAKNLHLKGMRHIEMYIRSKSNLLSSVIGQTGDTSEKREAPVEPFFLPPKFPRHR